METDLSLRRRNGSRSIPGQHATGGTGTWLMALMGCVIGRLGHTHPEPVGRCAGTCADHIAYEAGLATSTVQNNLDQAGGLGRRGRGDRATDSEPATRYQRDTPGELIHVDVEKLAATPGGGRWKVR